MKFNSSKLATMPRTLAGHLVLAELQAEARRERFAASFDQHFPDDDVPSVPNPMDSAQARRAEAAQWANQELAPALVNVRYPV
jgi:DNA-binding IclR family transcriptional regulator